MIDSTLNHFHIIKMFKIDHLMKEELARRPCLNPTVKMHYEHASAARCITTCLECVMCHPCMCETCE